MDYSPEKSNALLVASPAEAHDRIKTFLEEGPCDEDLLLKISWAVYISGPVQGLLKLARRRKNRFEFDSEFDILKIRAMPRPLHDAIQDTVSRLLVEACHTTLTAPERKYITCGIKQIYLSNRRLRDFGHKPQGLKKYPDAGLEFLSDDSTKPRYSVVFEVGLTQSHDDLRRDAF
ncbi:hypothetical protein BDV28DRAFT_145741 [Aspergillus coremiiformis]|uniref:Uncharacterized protein n=1 Tax=Aspergillus coremiiformis TaxID=138285 RepID=A0A5N6ZFF7_9EURO|nr:hypothetical protein BDV28DRAFT_145741 [Aspergillus coremiiformis]